MRTASPAREPLADQQKLHLWALNTAMQQSLPTLSKETIRHVALDFVRTQTSSKTLELVKQFSAITQEDRSRVEQIIGMDLVPAQLLLYMTSPSEERQPLFEQWQASWLKKANSLSLTTTHRGQEMIDQGWRRSTSAGSMAFLGVAAVTAPIYVAGLVFQSPDMMDTSIQTAQILSKQAFEMMQAIVQGSAMGLVMGAAKVGHMANTHSRDRRTALGAPKELETKLKALSVEADGSHVNGEPFLLSQALSSLAALPTPHCNLLRHFTARELVTFLEGDDSLREALLTQNPPSLEQRKQVISAESESFRENFNRQLKLMGTTWESEHSSEGQVVLKSSLLEMRKLRQQRLAAQTPNHGLPLPSAAAPKLG